MTPLELYSPMWSSEADQYLLIDVGGRDESRWVIVDRSTGGAVVVEEDESTYAELIARMKSAGVPQLSRSEWLDTFEPPT